MKYVKMLGLLAVMAAALMAFAGSASAIVVTESENNQIDAGDVIKATSEHSELTGSVPLTCSHSAVEGKVTQAGGPHGSPSTTTDLIGEITSLTWGTGGVCGTATISTVKGGTLTLSYIAKHKGTLTSNGAEVTALTHSAFLGTVHCIYKTSNTHIGVVNGNKLEIESAPIPEVATDTFACKDDAVWHGTYVITQPTDWTIDA